MLRILNTLKLYSYDKLISPSQILCVLAKSLDVDYQFSRNTHVIKLNSKI